MSDISKVDLSIDVTSLACPLPLMKIKGAMAHTTSGRLVEVNGVLPSDLLYIEEWISRLGHDLTVIEKPNSKEFSLIIKKV